MILVKKPEVKTLADRARLSAVLVVDGVARELYVEVALKYAEFLCPERSDAFVLGVLHFAMKNGHDIVCESPMTDRLLLQLTAQFLPAYYKVNNFTRDRSKIGKQGWCVKIEAPTAREVARTASGVGIGSGCSCGVDSMHVYAAHPDITHACVWNVHGITHDETSEKREVGWSNLIRQAQSFANEVGAELLVADSNFDRGCFPDLKFDGSISFGNLFFIFSLQKLWRRYYVASGYDITEFRMNSGVNVDPAHYEWAMFSFCSLDNITVAIDGADKTRIEKVADLINYPLSKRYLNVCWEINNSGKNCSYECAKCMRTMLELDAMEALDGYGDVFDVDYFRRNYHEYLAEYFRGLLHGDDYAKELRPYIVLRHISPVTIAKALLIVAKKIVKKILRGGKVDVSNFSSKG